MLLALCMWLVKQQQCKQHSVLNGLLRKTAAVMALEPVKLRQQHACTSNSSPVYLQAPHCSRHTSQAEPVFFTQCICIHHHLIADLGGTSSLLLGSALEP